MLLKPRRGPKGKSITMRLVRTILAFAIVVSLAMLPMGASAAGYATSSDEMHATMHMAGDADMAIDNCCPDDMKGTTSKKDGYKCEMGFCCVGGALGFGEVRVLGFELFLLSASNIAIPADQVVFYRGGSPPFRPPRG
jgi:hypothetical protein